MGFLSRLFGRREIHITNAPLGSYETRDGKKVKGELLPGESTAEQIAQRLRDSKEWNTVRVVIPAHDIYGQPLHDMGEVRGRRR